MKVGIIRCQQTEDSCVGTGCFNAVKKQIAAFEHVDNPEITGMVSCGGCPGKRAVNRVQMMVKNGTEVIALASCMLKGTPIEFPCPFYEQIKEAIKKKVGDNVLLLDYTH